MRKSHLFSVLIALSLCHTALADRIIVGDDEFVYVREELNMAQGGHSHNYSDQFGIYALAELKGRTTYAIGTGHGNLFMNDAYDSGWYGIHTAALTVGLDPVTALVSRADGHVAGGSAVQVANDALSFYRNADDLWLLPPGVTDGDAIFDGSEVTAVAALPNGHLAYATELGWLYLRDKDHIEQHHPGMDPNSAKVAFGMKIWDLAVDAAGNIVIARNDGYVETRHWSNILAQVGVAVQLESAIAITEVEILSDGKVVCGTANGHVWVRNAANDLGAGVAFAAYTAFQEPILALEVTSNDNVVISAEFDNDNNPGTPSFGQTWVRRGIDLALPAGLISGDGLVWDDPITALAAVAPPTASHPDGDRIMVGTIVEGTLQVGNVYGRDEYAMSVPIANYNPAFYFTGEGGITALAELKTPNKFAIGTSDGWLHSKDAFDLNWDGGVIMMTSGSGGPLDAVGTLVGRTDGHIAGGTDGFGPANGIFYRDWTNVQQDAPVGGSAWSWYNNDDFVASDVLPNGNLVFAAAGYMWIVDQDNTGNKLGETGFAFGNWVQDVAADQTTGNIVVAHTYGGLEVYDSANLGAGPIGVATLLAGNGSQQFTEVEVLSDGLVVAGTSLGTVYTFADSADLFADISGAFTFSSGAITALEVTSNDNVVIAAPSVNDPNKSVTWVRQGHNIDSPPVGMEGSDGVLWDNHVHAIAAVPFLVLDGDIDGDGDADKDDLAVMGGQWLACSDPGGQNCQPVQQVRTIEAGTATVDADLGDWTNAHWIQLNQIYFQNPAEDGVPDVSEAKFALRWDAASDKIYCAVVVEDANNIYTDGWGGNWNVSDRIEIYSQGSAAGGSFYGPEHDFAQQYVIGANDTQPGAWAVFGFNDGPVGPSNAEIAVAKSPGQVIYEVAIVQYDNYAENGGDPNTVITDLVDGSTVGFDVLVGSKFSPDSADFGLLSENLDLDKNIHASNFAQYKLVQSATQCGDWGYFSADITEDCIVNYFDFSILGLDWMMDINP